METVNEKPLAGPEGSGTGTDLAAGGAFHETRDGWVVLAIVWVACAAYMFSRLRIGLVPLDAGALAEMADRVLRGQVPFRNFVDNYTGGLTYLNALAFRLFGVNFFSLRIPLFLFFLGWVPSLYLIARRFVGPLGAGMVTLLSVAWSVPNYPEAMPSWYNLFFATWGVLALIRYTEDEKTRWLWIAGLCGGLSFLVKIIGLYFVAAVLLFLVFRERSRNRRPGRESHLGRLWYRLFVSAGLILFLASVFNLVSWGPSATNYVQFVLPSACLVAMLLWATWRGGLGNGREHFLCLIRTGLPFLAGGLAPVSIFLLWFASRGALGDWFRGVFVTPTTRLEWASYSPPLLATWPGLLPAFLVALLAFDPQRSSRKLVRFSSPAVLAAILFAAYEWPAVYTLAGYSMQLLVPFLALAGAFCIRRLRGAQAQKVFLVVGAAVICALVQFPQDSANYFNYVVPLVILAFAALVSTRPNHDRLAVGSLLAFYLIFALWLGTPGYWLVLRMEPWHTVPLAALDLSRAGGIRMRADEASEYERLVAVIHAHARGPYVYCTPDCPGVYFLSGKFNPTPTINDFLDRDFLDVPVRSARILDTVADRGVDLVAISHGLSVQSGPVPAGLLAALDADFPRSEKVGRFEVRWKPQARERPQRHGAARVVVPAQGKGGRD